MCLGDRASQSVRPIDRPCLSVTHAPAVVESKLRFDEQNPLGVAAVTQQPPDGWGELHHKAEGRGGFGLVLFYSSPVSESASSQLGHTNQTS